MRILVVDDSKAMRMIVVRTLRQAGFDTHDVLEAEDGRQGLVMATSQEPDLILSDWNMPGMSGIEFLRALRASGSGVPFCFVTSEGSAEMRDTAIAGGALELITKPFTAETFQDTLGPLVTA